MNRKTGMNWQTYIENQINEIRENSQWRQTIPTESKEYLVFASNDYLGLKSNKRVIKAVTKATTCEVGTGASRLVTGTRQIHKDLESQLADYKNTESALVFSSGYSANIGVLSVLGTTNVCIISDELNHASIVDGCRLSRSEVLKFSHRNLKDCENKINEALNKNLLPLVVTDSVFSMDGDIADINSLGDLCKKYNSFLVIDDAHNVFNEHYEIDSDRTSIVGTLSKTLGSLGGYVAGKQEIIDLLVNKARSFIFTTALSVADTAAALESLRIINSDEGQFLLDKLKSNIIYFKKSMEIDSKWLTPIVPVIIGSEDKALEVAKILKENKIIVPAIRPPTVPKGTSRLRITLSALHEFEEIDFLVSALKNALTVLNK
jgi:glycine C-acetyltransferase